MKSYAIMHAERHVATIREDGSCTVYCPGFMPYNLYFERADEVGLSSRINNLNNFFYWCASRLLTLDRRYAKEILNSLGYKQAVTDRERADIALSYHALNLTDVYWVRPLRETVTYENINLYDHSLSGAFVDVSLRGQALTAKNARLIGKDDAASDLSTSGVAPKAWIREGDTFYLLKGGDEADVEAELLSSRLARCFDVPQVMYEPLIYQGQTVSKSALITSKEKSIVPTEHVDVYAANTGTTLDAIVKKHDAYGYHMMNIIDYLIGNTDRHWGNWGFWVDNKDNRLQTLHPLMDFNRAFRAYDGIEGARCLTSPKVISQKDAAIEAVREVGLNQTTALPNDLKSLFGRANDLFNARLDVMFEQRLDILQKAASA